MTEGLEQPLLVVRVRQRLVSSTEEEMAEADSEEEEGEGKMAEEEGELTTSPVAILSVDCSADSALVMSGCADATAKVFNVASGKVEQGWIITFVFSFTLSF